MAELLLLNGPNLNLLGTRQPELYGTRTLAAVEAELQQLAAASGHRLAARQSNAEHELVEAVQHSPNDGVELILLNPGAFTHTSVALRDALLAVAIPFIEIHMTNVHAREPFRRHSYFSDISIGSIIGFGAQSYRLALQAALAILESTAD